MIESFLWAWLSTIVLSLCAWIHYLIFRINSIIDVFWSLGILLAGLLISASHLDLCSQLIKTMTILWSLRLATFLYFTRVITKKSDHRYDEISSYWKNSKAYGYFWNFQLQALLMVSLTAPFFFLGTITITPYFWTMYCLMGLAILGESLSDFYLYKHMQSKSKDLCLKGPWKYSRHPNYFFDWMFWLCFAGMALPYSYGWLALSSPLILFGIMNILTIPISERNSIARRKDTYLKYQKSTSTFIPWFKK